MKQAIIIGAGIVGLATARALALRGYKVTVFERSGEPVGASIRNFGMIWPIGQTAGTQLDQAMLSRSIWKQICTEAGIWHSEKGSLHLAYKQDELKVMEEFVDVESSHRNCGLLTPEQVKLLTGSAQPKGLLGGLWSESEMIVEARVAVKAVANYLAARFNVGFHYNTAISSINHPTVFSGKRSWSADEIFICSGIDFETLYPEIFSNAAITKCKIQMMRLAAQQDIGPSLCGGLSMIHYSSFKSATSLSTLQERYQQEYADYIKWGIHVMVSQNGDSELTVGDSHEYGLTHEPFDKVFINKLILDYLKTFATFKEDSLIQSWHGIYAKMTNGQTSFITKPEDGVTIINGMGGAGMTLSFGMTERYFEKGQ
jgi:FAD dependent oxidoreductase TIGR03364